MVYGTAGFTAALSVLRLEENGLTQKKGKVLVRELLVALEASLLPSWQKEAMKWSQAQVKKVDMIIYIISVKKSCFKRRNL